MRQIDGDQEKFNDAIQARSGATKEDVFKWVNRRYASGVAVRRVRGGETGVMMIVLREPGYVAGFSHC